METSLKTNLEGKCTSFRTAPKAVSPHRYDPDVLEIPVDLEGALEGALLHVVEGDDPDVSPGAVLPHGRPGLFNHPRHFPRVGEALSTVFDVRSGNAGSG